MKNTKRILAVALSLMMAVAGSALAENYTAGIYTASANGNNGPVKVEVAFSGDSIESVTIVEHGETAGICDVAVERIPAKIVEGQTLAVDTVSGATNTSKAILAAVEDCAAQAGADVEALKAKTADETAEKKIVAMTADVIAIGGGGAGMTAAVRAGQLGATCIVVEKLAQVGGATANAQGNYAAVDPEKQIPQGIEDSIMLQIQQTYQSGDCQGKLDLIETMAYRALDGVHWLEDLGVEFSDTMTTVVGAIWPRTHGAIGKGTAIVEKLKAAADACGAQFLMETTATELIVEDGRVVGCKAVGADGTEYELRANYGVVMATGGFGKNTEMLKQWNPNIPEGVVSLANAGSTGDGIVMGEAVGASLMGMQYIQMVTTSGAVLTGASIEDVLYFNAEGDRYVAEDSRRDVLCNASFNQPGSVYFVLTDQSLVDRQGNQEAVDAAVAAGTVTKADSLEELAVAMGMDAAKLTAAVEAYNACVDTKTPDAFGRYTFNHHIDQAPFYFSAPLRPMILYTCGGLEINSAAQVLDAAAKAPIPGLYAAGEVAGGLHGVNRIAGNGISEPIIFGQIAVESMMADK